MKVLAVLLSVLLVAAEGTLQKTYSPSAESQAKQTPLQSSVFVKGDTSIRPDASAPINCGPGKVAHPNGQCITPLISANPFLYGFPFMANGGGFLANSGGYLANGGGYLANGGGYLANGASQPFPQVMHNVIYVHLPEDQNGLQSVFAPPPVQKNIIYLLRKNTKGDTSAPEVIVPSPPKHTPEVHLVTYNEGENPILPSGQDLNSAILGSQYVLGNVVEGNPGKGGSSAPDIIVPSPLKTTPEVHLVTYNEGENPILPSGQDLNSALFGRQYVSGNVARGNRGTSKGNSNVSVVPPNRGGHIRKPSPPDTLYNKP